MDSNFSDYKADCEWKVRLGWQYWKLTAKWKEQGKLTRVTNRVVQSSTYKIAPACRVRAKQRTAKKTRNLETKTSGTEHSKEKKDETIIKNREDETERGI